MVLSGVRSERIEIKSWQNRVSRAQFQKPPSNSWRAPSEEELTEFKSAVLAKLALAVGKDAASATDRDWFVATAHAIRDRIIHRWLSAERASNAQGRKRVYYLSLEFLIGRLLSDVLCNLGISDVARAALGDLGVNPNRLRSAEPDAALGNGGLGRLAACFMESMASLGIPAYGYGIRYDHGLFRQVIKDGWQQEYPEDWLSFGNPWEFARPEVIYDIHFGGRVETLHEAGRAARYIWLPHETIEAVAYDTPIVGWRGRNVNPLRLWTARAVDPVRLDAFNRGDHIGALVEQSRAEAISKVLYPSDETPAGRELRLRQEYFFVSASLQDLVARHLRTDGDLHFLPQRAAIQLNDTHPSIAIAELMRLLIDVHGMPWSEAWTITVGTFSYTNHTLLPEALETWPVYLFERVLPRHLQIIYRINAAAHRSGKTARTQKALPNGLPAISLIDEHGDRKLRMGHLAFVGSHQVNGVSALHTGLMRETVFRDLHAIYPDRIVNKTNGVTFRRWLLQANPALVKVLCEVCGDAVLDDPSLIGELADKTGDFGLQERIAAAKRANKVALSTAGRRPHGHPSQSRCDVRRADQAHSRIQAPAPQHPGDGRDLSRHPRRAQPALGAAGEDLRRQGGRELRAGQADHQADQRRRQGGERRSDHARPAAGRVPARLQCQPGGGDHSCRRPVGANLDRRHGGVRHRQHEARAQRRADHRHARRRQCRDPRARRPGQHLHLWLEGARGRGATRARASMRAPPSQPRRC